MRLLVLPGMLASLLACGGSSDPSDGGQDDSAGDDASGDGSGDDGDDSAGDGSSGPPGPFDDEVTAVRIELDHETGAEPYVGEVIGFGDVWDIFRTNGERLFGGSRDLVVPATLDEMEDIGPVDITDLTVDDILAVADSHRDLVADAQTATFYVVFLDGYFADDSGRRDTVLGVSIGDTGVVAMFKPVIESTGSALFPNLSRFVEQSTLVHEFGHAVGLVDRGVPMVTPHKDDEHGAHCSDESCVMYWLNEGAADAAEFARMYITTGDVILFGDECLEDVDALTGS